MTKRPTKRTSKPAPRATARKALRALGKTLDYAATVGGLCCRGPINKKVREYGRLARAEGKAEQHDYLRMVVGLSTIMRIGQQGFTNAQCDKVSEAILHSFDVTSKITGAKGSGK